MKHNASAGPTELILSRLHKHKRTGDGRWMCSCPAHGGNDCLSITEKDGKTLVYCFSGCSTEEVMESIGLSLRDLFSDSLNPERRREYDIRSAQAARREAQLIVDIAEAQTVSGGMSNEDIRALADAHDRLNAAEQTLKRLDALNEPEPTDNPFLRRLAYDSDEAIERIANQQWLIDTVIPADSFGVIYGPSGTYKSFLAMDMSASIASKLQWHGTDVDNAGHVLYIAAEGAAGLHLRKKAWEIRHQHRLTNLGILGSAVTINNALECEQLIQLCEAAADEIKEPIKLIVVDTLARSFEGEENSATDMGAFVRSCDRIRESTGATVMVIHHAGKDADKGARGSSALRAACDFEFKVTSTGKKVTKMTCTKAKDSDPFDDMDFKLEIVEIGRKDAKGRDMVSLVPRQAANEEIPRDDLTGHAKILNDLISGELARNETVNKEFIRDAFYHTIGAKDRKAFGRAMDKLTSDEWIFVDRNDNITRNMPF